MSSFKHKDIISMADFNKDEINYILDYAAKLESDPDKFSYMQGKILATVFYETSTRTKISFNVAMKRLGGNVIGFSHFKNASFLKGESFYDTMKILEGYSDIMAIRAPWEGAARYAGEICKIPVINAGDGSNQHPTQTLLDLYTIKQTQGKLDNLKVAMVGDLKYGRTVHSLLTGLSLYDNVELYFVSPKMLSLPDQYLQLLDARSTNYHVLDNYQDIINEVDILYVTRLQRERFPDDMEFNKVRECFVINTCDIENVKDTMRILHPLPRVGEIHPDVDKSKHAFYFEQAENGVIIREALIKILMER
jgi:aspartate carbamoyltransferase catalytic subunit